MSFPIERGNLRQLQELPYQRDDRRDFGLIPHSCNWIIYGLGGLVLLGGNSGAIALTFAPLNSYVIYPLSTLISQCSTSIGVTLLFEGDGKETGMTGLRMIALIKIISIGIAVLSCYFANDLFSDDQTIATIKILTIIIIVSLDGAIFGLIMKNREHIANRVHPSADFQTRAFPLDHKGNPEGELYRIA